MGFYCGNDGLGAFKFIGRDNDFSSSRQFGLAGFSGFGAPFITGNEKFITQLQGRQGQAMHQGPELHGFGASNSRPLEKIITINVL